MTQLDTTSSPNISDTDLSHIKGVVLTDVEQPSSAMIGVVDLYNDNGQTIELETSDRQASTQVSRGTDGKSTGNHRLFGSSLNTHVYRDADIAFLEIEATQDTHYFNYLSVVLHAVRRINPCLPVVLVCASDDPDILIQAIELEVAACLPAHVPGNAVPADRLTRLNEVVSRYRDTKRRMNVELTNGVVIKRGPYQETTAQIAFLKSVPDELKRHFVEVIHDWDESDGQFAAYEMPYYEMKSARSLILQSSAQSADMPVIQKTLTTLLDLVLGTFFSHPQKTHPEPQLFVNSTFFSRADSRRASIRALLEDNQVVRSLPWAPVLHAVINGEELFRTETVMENPHSILERLRNCEDFLKMMTPPYLCFVHGDLHLKNVLVDAAIGQCPRLKLIDPKGFTFVGHSRGYGDVAYDIGKLLLSTHAQFDLIDEGYSELLTSSGETSRTALPSNAIECPRLRDIGSLGGNGPWIEHPMESGATPAEIIVHRRQCKPWVPELLSRMEKLVLRESRRFLMQDQRDSDPYWEWRARFHEAMHCYAIGLLKFQKAAEASLAKGPATCDARQTSKRAVAACVRGVELFNGLTTLTTVSDVELPESIKACLV